MLARRTQSFADMSAAATLRLTAAWSGVVCIMALVLIFARLFS
jgi:hypothetical protein